MLNFRQVLVWFGIGGAKARILLDEAEHPRGSRATGRVQILGGMAPQEVQRLCLAFFAVRDTDNKRKTCLLDQLIVAESIAALPRAMHEFPFAFDVPDHPPDEFRPGRGQMEMYEVRAELETRSLLSSSASASLSVTMHREVTAVDKAMQDLGFRTYRPAFSLLDPPPEIMKRHYRPPAALADQLEEAVLTLEVGHEWVTGQLDLNPRETTLREKMKALVVTEFRTFPLAFRRPELLAADGAPRPGGALPGLQQILDEALVLPDNEKNRLLRPAASPIEEVLLRPAPSSAAIDPDRLLRASEEEER